MMLGLHLARAMSPSIVMWAINERLKLFALEKDDDGRSGGGP